MKQKTWRVLCTAFLLALVTLGFGQSNIPERPNPPRLVNDYIGLLPSETVARMEQQLVNYDNQTSIQIAVVIVNSADPDISTVAPEIGQKWGVGQKGLDNGVVLMLAVQQHKVFIATGYGVEEFLPSIICARICEQTMKPYFKQGDYAGGVQAGLNAIIETLKPLSWDQRQEFQKLKKKQEEAANQEMWDSISWIGGFSLFFIIVGLIIWRTRSKQQRIKAAVADTKKRFAAIQADEVRITTDWPTWAKSESKEIKRKYDLYEDRCLAAINKLPEFFFSRLFFDESKFESLKKQLDDFDAVDQALTKIRDDVKFYDERSEKALQDIAAMLKDAHQFVDNYSTSHNFTNEQEQLRAISKESEALTITDGDSKKACFLAAHALAERVTAVRKVVEAEIAAQRQVEQSLKAYESSSKNFPKVISTYLTALESLAKYPSTVLSGLEEARIFETRFDTIQNQYTNAKSKLTTKARGMYADALLRFNTLNSSVSYVESLAQTASNRVTQLEEKKNAYASQVKDAQGAISRAKRDIADSDVGTAARNYVRDAEELLDKGTRLAQAAKVDWILVSQALSEAESKAREASRKAQSDKNDAARERARKKREAEEAEDAARRASYASTTYYSSSSSSSDTGGGFGGFGGGSFSGGGGGSDW